MEQLRLVYPDKKISHLLSPDEIYHAADESLLSELKEDRRIERKPAKTHPPILGQYFSMWANTVPSGGLLVLGMEDDGSFSGCSLLSPNELNDREKAYRTHCPECRTESKRIGVTNIKGREDFIVLFRTFYREDKVVPDASGNAYTRIGVIFHEHSPI